LARTYVNFPPTPGGGFSLDGGSRTWIWDLSRKRARLPLSQYGTGLALSADGKFLATGWGTRPHMGRLNICTSGPAKGIHLWEVDSGKEVLHFTVPEDEATVLALSPDGTKLVAGHKSGTDRSRSGQHLERRALNRRFGPVVRT